MIERFSLKNITWLEVCNPTQEEVREIVAEANIPPEFANDLTVMIPQTETFFRKNALKITLDFPIVRRTDINHPHEVKFIVTKTHLVTIRFEDIEAIHRFGKEFEVRCLLQNGKQTTTPTLLVVLLNFMYQAMYSKLDFLEAKAATVEEGIFNNKEKEMVYEISQISRRLIAFRKTLHAHEGALLNLPEAMASAFGKKYFTASDSLYQHYKLLIQQVAALSSTIDDLRETNIGLVTTKQNEVMKTFTILAFITFPLTLFTSLFGMNTNATPILGHPKDFWIIAGIMGVVSILFFIFFKYKKWM